MSAEQGVIAALRTALLADAGVTALVGTRVYDGQAPAGAAYPYTVLGGATEVDDGDLTDEGWSVTLTVHDWSEYRGRKEVLDIRAARDDVMHRQTITVSGYAPVFVQREFAEVVIDTENPDEPLRHGVSRYRASAWAS